MNNCGCGLSIKELKELNRLARKHYNRSFSELCPERKRNILTLMELNNAESNKDPEKVSP